MAAVTLREIVGMCCPLKKVFSLPDHIFAMMTTLSARKKKNANLELVLREDLHDTDMVLACTSHSTDNMPSRLDDVILSRAQDRGRLYCSSQTRAMKQSDEVAGQDL